jgi:hypothetical protein
VESLKLNADVSTQQTNLLEVLTYIAQELNSCHRDNSTCRPIFEFPGLIRLMGLHESFKSLSQYGATLCVNDPAISCKDVTVVDELTSFNAKSVNSAVGAAINDPKKLIESVTSPRHVYLMALKQASYLGQEFDGQQPLEDCPVSEAIGDI